MLSFHNALIKHRSLPFQFCSCQKLWEYCVCYLGEEWGVVSDPSLQRGTCSIIKHKIECHIKIYHKRDKTKDNAPRSDDARPTIQIWRKPGSCWVTNARTQSGLCEFRFNNTFWMHCFDILPLWIAKLILGETYRYSRKQYSDMRVIYTGFLYWVPNLNPCLPY